VRAVRTRTKSVDLVDQVDPFPTVPFGSVGMNSSLAILRIDQKHIHHIH
jgi:hypothetical protein